MPANSVIQLRRGTAAQWTSANPVLASGEPGYETDTGKEKRGDGTTAWNSLPYSGAGAYAPLTHATRHAPGGLDDLSGSYTSREYADGTFTPLSHLTDTDPHGDRAYTDAQLALLRDDPLGMGFPATFLVGEFGGQQTWPTANDARYARVIGAGTITKIGMHVYVQSGNVQVAVIPGTGTGRSRVPGVRAAASAIVACPAVGYQEISLGSSLYVKSGDYMAMWCDNTTASFSVANSNTTNLYSGYGYSQAVGASGIPANPTVFGTINASMGKQPLLVGVA